MHLDSKLNKSLEHLDAPNSNHYAGDKQIIYLTFEPEQVIEVKKRLSNWLSMVKAYEYNYEIVSMATVINEFLRKNQRRSSWEIPDTDGDLSEIQDFFRKDLASIVVENKVIETAILSAQEKLKNVNKPLLIISDLESIHPFTRFGPIEQKLYVDIQVPILVLYPGTLSGSSLEFLGFYPPDGNYRSKHF